jgi:hypothetical protein
MQYLSLSRRRGFHHSIDLCALISLLRVEIRLRRLAITSQPKAQQQYRKETKWICARQDALWVKRIAQEGKRFFIESDAIKKAVSAML